MARTSAKAKKPKQDVNKSTVENTNQIKVNKDEVKPAKDIEDTHDSTDKENDDTNYEVEKVVHTRMLRGKRQYLVRWKGYNEDSDTWENESVLQSCEEALELFKRENPSLSEKLRADSDGEAEDERSLDSEDEKKKEKKRAKKGTKKLIIIDKYKKMNASSTKEISDSEVQPPTESGEEIQEKVNNESKKVIKKESKMSFKRGSGKNTKDETDEPEKKKKKKSEVTDDVNDTEDKNYEVDKILEVHTRKDGSREFLIRWKGYKPSEDTWEPEAHLDCQDLIDKFMEKVVKAKSIPARELRESRTPTNRYIPVEKVRGGRSNLRNSGFRPSYQE